MKEKLQPRTKYFIINLLQYFFIVAVAVLVLSIGWNEYEPFDIKQGLSIVGFFSIIILGFKIALDFTNNAYRQKD